MAVSEVATRYAKALFDLAAENNNAKPALEQMRALKNIFEKDQELLGFLKSPLIKTEEKEKSLAQALKGAGLLNEVESFLLLLAGKNRLPLFSEILTAYQTLTDEANGVTRGVVRSATVLSQNDRKRIEETVSKYTNKNVILTYKEDEELLGGLIAEVGSYTFDDTLTSHLKRLNEELKRSAH
ncbi:MAG: ATP synthase F1 subunit delta [Bdellovibrionaceae bacterium]|nr:ATP synthase F1 subunit delta [Bdellovibrionales bacterium]MCB9085469.1 ATP synthase F1 subunit delta [Pseudobdellovibrionaceae bacterium]